jgi:predicted Zn-dependent protease
MNQASGDVPFSNDEARTAASYVLDWPGADGVEVMLTGSRTGLTRYANSQIIQNTVKNDIRAYVRVAKEGRTATATTTQLDADHMGKAAARALEAAAASPVDPEWPGFPDPAEVGRAEGLMRWDEATARASAGDRAQAVKQILDVAKVDNAAGVYETSGHSFAVLSSAGIDCFDAYTRSVCTCLVDTGSATGWGEASSHSMAEVDVEAAARKSLDKAAAGEAPSDADPGTYEVVLEEPAVATLLEYLSYAGFGAKQVLEGESFLAERAGQNVASPLVTIADDVFHPRSIGIGFDFEGVPKKRVAVIDSGRATGPVTDLRHARKMNAELTGHASGSNEFGPYASQVVMEPKDRSLDELIAEVDDGILVTRFHYVNILERPSTLLTGMTRDGTFRIKNGEVAGALRNFRFAQSVLDALASVQSVGRQLGTVAADYGPFGSTVAPALRIGEFHFASRTSH